MRKIHHEKKYFLIVIIKSNEKPLTFCKHMLCHVLNVTLYFNYEELIERHKNRFLFFFFFGVLKSFSTVQNQEKEKESSGGSYKETIFIYGEKNLY